MKNPLRLHDSRASLHCVAPIGKWTVFWGETGLVHKVSELLQEQAKLLETASLLSRVDLEIYERRSERISELIRLLAEE